MEDQPQPVGQVLQPIQDGSENPSYIARFSAALLLATLLLASCPGCSDNSPKPRPIVDPSQFNDQLFTYAIDNLHRMEEFDATEVRGQLIERLSSIDATGQLPAALHNDRLLATWPEPEILQQIVSRLNQWAQSQEAPAWKRDPLLAKLPPLVAGSPMLRDLDSSSFSPYDGFAVQEAIWLRSVSTWARGRKIDKLPQAGELFDWTVRNVQLDSDAMPQYQVPWETLLLGHGSAMDRAWVFILLCRQQGLDAAVLALPKQAALSLSPSAAEEPHAKPGTGPASSARLRPWVVAVLIDGQAYLFDPGLGLPIPGPDGVKLGGTRQLDITPATLEQVQKDPSLLRRLDLQLERPYWVGANDLKQVVVLLEGSPAYLSRRMKLIESHLSGKQRVVLTASPSEQAERFRKALGADDTRLWTLPYYTLRARSEADLTTIKQRLAWLLPFYTGNGTPLLKGRLLYLKGKLTGQPSAVESFQHARPANSDLAAASNLHLDEKRVYLFTKYQASYWLGLTAFDQGNYASAVDYLQNRTINMMPAGPWTPGAHYNLGRTYEAMGERDKALATYRADEVSPASYGNQLRARWLKEVMPEPEQKEERQL